MSRSIERNTQLIDESAGMSESSHGKVQKGEIILKKLSPSPHETSAGIDLGEIDVVSFTQPLSNANSIENAKTNRNCGTKTACPKSNRNCGGGRSESGCQNTNTRNPCPTRGTCPTNRPCR